MPKDNDTFPMPPAPAGMSAEQFAAVVAAAVAVAVKQATEGSADIHAEAMKRALKPENASSPMKSVYNPAGEFESPKPALKAQVTLFDGIPIDGSTDTVEELNLYNQLEHGEYFVDRSDGTRMPFKVREIRNDMHQLQRIDISFPYRDEADRAGVLPMKVWLRDVVAQIAERKATALAR